MGLQVQAASTVLSTLTVNGTETVNGQLSAAQVATTGGGFFLDTVNGGAAMSLKQAAAAPSGPAANQLELYVRPGSAAGLSLRCKAGNGAETIIIDNVPIV